MSTSRAIHTSEPLIALQGVCHHYCKDGVEVPVLRDVSLHIHRGETCAIRGASGAGKSTLLNILGLLDRPSGGRFRFAGRDMLSASPDDLAGMRNREIGFVFQAFNLLPRLTALDNVALPLLYRGVGRCTARGLAMTQLERLGLADRALHRPADLSGGQLQRVAIGRALVGEPSLVLADEPTGNLDHDTAEEIVQLLLELNCAAGVTLVTVTHDKALATRFGRQMEVKDGILRETGLPTERGA